MGGNKYRDDLIHINVVDDEVSKTSDEFSKFVDVRRNFVFFS